MTKPDEGRSSLLDPALWLLVVLLGLGTALVISPAFLPPLPRNDSRQLFRDLSSLAAGKGRLFHAEKQGRSVSESLLGKFQLAVLLMPESEERQHLQSLIYLARKDWPRAVETLSRLNLTSSQDAEIMNDLGVAYLQLAKDQPANYFKALRLFERATILSPAAAAPVFNIAVVYREVRLVDSEEVALQRYKALEAFSPWLVELTPPTAPDASELISELRSALNRSEYSEASVLFNEHLQIYRQAAMEFALNPADPEETDPAVGFIVDELEKQFRDRTIAEMLAPLHPPFRDRIIESRKLVRSGAEAYLEGRLQESLRFYDQAALLITDADSPFDQAWVELNRADAEIRSGNFARARQLLDSVIEKASGGRMRWLLAQAQTALGSNSPLTRSYTELLDVLNEAAVTFPQIGAPRDAARPLYYLAVAHYIAGDLDNTLKLTFNGLDLTSDHIRLSQFFWLASSALYRLGFPEFATQFQESSVHEAELAGNLQITISATSHLASMYEATNDYANAELYMERARKAAEVIDNPTRRMIIDFNLNLLCGRIHIRRREPARAVECLENNLGLFTNEQVPKYFVSESLRLLGHLHTDSGDVEQARTMFREAVETAEGDDNYFAVDGLRLSFDTARRDLYDSAISFEYVQGETDLAWSYAQRYRSKLFLEFLGIANPAVVEVHSEAIQRQSIQRLIPQDLQVVEYVLLHDRLLIWVVSDSVFASKSILISRSDIEKRVQDFVERLRREEDVTELSQDLYQVLITPIKDVLDPKRTVAIVPDQVLHRLPFAALRDADVDSYLISQYAVLESPNLTHLLAAAPRSPRRDSIVSFGSLRDDTSYAREFIELDRVYASASTITGGAAVKSAFLETMTSAPVFHYAGHSTDAADPLRSSVLLDGDREGPNSVSAVDISQQRMRENAVVVLASCDSSVGNSRDGVGMRGLTSAFLISGAGSVVGSLWPVEVTSTSDLVIGFHEAFASEQLPVAEALRQAQLAFLKKFPEKSHPYYWSGFVVTGNTSAIR